MKYYRVGSPDSDLSVLDLSEIIIEVDTCYNVTREVVISIDGNISYFFPNNDGKSSFRGMFDGQTVNYLIGEEIDCKKFEQLWELR